MTILLVNQSIDPLCKDITELLRKKCSVKIFKGINYSRSFLIFRFASWLIFTIQLIIHLILFKKRYTKILVVTNPPLTQFVVGISGIPYSILVYDIYPNVIAQLNLPRLIYKYISKIWGFLNIKIYKKANYIFTLSNEMSNELKIYFPKLSEWKQKVVLISPWINKNLSEIKINSSISKKRFYTRKDLLITYCGNIGLTHPIEYLVDSAFISKINYKILIIGKGQKRLILYKLAKSKNLLNKKVFFHNPLPINEMIDQLSYSDLALVALDENVSNYSLPSKTFTYLYSGTPILCIAPRSSALAKIINKYNCGFIIEPNVNAPIKIEKLIQKIISNREILIEKKKNTLKALENFSIKNAEILINLITK